MTDGDRDSRNSGKNDNAAKTLATIALVVAIIALLWAIKADKRAGDALDKAQSSSSAAVHQGGGH